MTKIKRYWIEISNKSGIQERMVWGYDIQMNNALDDVKKHFKSHQITCTTLSKTTARITVQLPFNQVVEYNIEKRMIEIDE